MATERERLHNLYRAYVQVAEHAKAAKDAATGDKARAAWKEHLMEDAAEGGTGVDSGDVGADDDRQPFLYFEDYAHLRLDYAGAHTTPSK